MERNSQLEGQPLEGQPEVRSRRRDRTPRSPLCNPTAAAAVDDAAVFCADRHSDFVQLLAVGGV
ncbi:MAG: hypothetical protein HC832_01220 [Leptolyngbyaceae cyanobacterium RM1_405_57]|nr:hypothetical protein [Leptolyngbyaceae cyanobacterium RM1_405_57]